MDVCFVSFPVTRNAIGWPAKVTSLPSPGIRITAFALIMLLQGLAFCRALQLLQHDPAAPAGREIVPKTLQNISEWYPLNQWGRSTDLARSASTRTPKYYFAVPSRSCWANARLRCFGCFWSGRERQFPKLH